MPFRNQIRQVIDVVTVLSPSAYLWLGLPDVRDEHDPAVVREHLTARLYSDFYASGGTPRIEIEPPQHSPQRIIEFESKLSDANTGHGFREGGWLVRNISGERLLVEHDGLTFGMDCHDVRSVQTGDELFIEHPKGNNSISPGYYFACGNYGRRCPNQPVFRFYWHLTPAGAIEALHAITTSFNQAGLPFQFKVLTDPFAYCRADAGVLYLSESVYRKARPLLERVHAAVKPYLSPTTPAFTKALGPGLGAAQDQGDGSSFGMARCRLLAKALLEEPTLESVERHFSEAEIDLDHPYLQTRANEDPFEVISSESAPRPGPRGESVNPLEIAARIGADLESTAIWYQGRCNWVGIDEGRVWKSLGPDLYQGTAGVGLFLARLATHTGVPAIRRAACGALLHSLDAHPLVPLERQLGFYSGCPGIACAAVEVGRRLGNEGLMCRGEALAGSMGSVRELTGEVDLMCGRAGGLMALLTLGHRDAALALGEEILNWAVTTPAGQAWRTPGHEGAPLAGFSHGASGIAWALLELWHVGGDSRFRDAALEAFIYEDSTFDPQVQNWADLRRSTEFPPTRQSTASYMTAWCHGAPGIALARSRAAELLNCPQLQATAEIALETTRRDLRRQLDAGSMNFSLCHGMLGNAEIVGLLSSPPFEPLIAEVAQRAEECGREGFWPCDFPGETPPALLTGLAGIGHFYLRIHAPEVQSVLFPVSPV
jgi:hypothetical protein